MFRSLRWKLIAAFSLTILVTILLSGALSIWMTFSRFDILVTDESRYKAQTIAPIFEASYAHWGNWDNLELLLAGSTDTPPVEFFQEAWYSGADWFQISAQTLDMDEVKLLNTLDQGQSLTEIAYEQGTDIDTLRSALLNVEKASLEAAVAAGTLTDEQAVEEYFWLREDIEYFLSDNIPILEESIYTSEIIQYDPYLLTAIDLTDAGTDWLLANLLPDNERLMVADAGGIVVFDSLGERTGEILSRATLNQGIQLFYPDQDEEIGTIIVAVEPENYTAQQIAFLKKESQALVISGLAAGGIALMIGFLIARSIAAPVTALTTAANKIAAGNENERLPVASDDELGTMSTAFNSMAESLQTQRKLRERLVDDVTHELNTPLSVIQLEIEALRDGMQSAEEASVHVNREIKMLQTLVNDLSLLSENAEGALKLECQLIDYPQLAAESVTRWQPRAEENRVNLSMTAPSNLPEIPIDPLRMTQVLGNLLSNALQHTSAGDEIELIIQANDSHIITTVQDQGTGISADNLPFIFERFYRAEQSRDRRTGGQGLGLSIVKQIIELHGGTIQVHSQPGKGSSFEFRLPYPREQ